jgi:hypothetical protein
MTARASSGPGIAAPRSCLGRVATRSSGKTSPPSSPPASEKISAP